MDRAISRRHPAGTATRVLAAAATLLLALLIAVPAAAAAVVLDTAPLDELDILAVRDGDPTQVLFSAPARFLTQTLTNADVAASVDGTTQQVQLRQLGAADLEVAVVIDTSVGVEQLRAQQGAVVELALNLPQGATMRIIDATGNASGAVAVPGQAIAAVRQLEPDTGDQITAAVQQARSALNTSSRDRTALVVVGFDLAGRLGPIDGLPFTRVAYVIDVGVAEGGQSLLGPNAGGTVIRIDSTDRLLMATDQVAQELRSLYLAQVPRPAQDAQTLTLAIPGAEDVAARTVQLGTGTLRPAPVTDDQPQEARDGDGGQQEQADGGQQEQADGADGDVVPQDEAAGAPEGEPAGGDQRSFDLLVPIALAVLVIGSLVALWPVTRHLRQRTRPVTTAGDAAPPPAARAEDPDADGPWASAGWAAWSAGDVEAAEDLEVEADDARAEAGDDEPADAEERVHPAAHSATAPPTGSTTADPVGTTTAAPGPTDTDTDTDATDGDATDSDELDRVTPSAAAATGAGAAATAAAGATGAPRRTPDGGPDADDDLPRDVPPRRGRRQRERPTRPIAKLTTDTREALARAHLGLRQLALASRSAAENVPDELFRLHEATASVALHGAAIDLRDVLLADLDGAEPTEAARTAQRSADALVTGWQHTARRTSAPPPVLEINAVLSGGRPRDRRPGPKRPVAPVRALNPLIEIGLEHVVLAGHDSDDSDLVARAVTAVDIMRAARLPRPVLALSPELQAHATEYAVALEADLNDAGERDAWLELLCECVWRAASTCADRVNRLDRLRARYREQAADTRLLPLVDVLLARPLLDARLLTERLPISRDDATMLLATAHDTGWVHPYPNADDAWVAGHVLALFGSEAARTRSSQPA